MLSRIFPKGLRMASSNYTPQPLWNRGCQLVALNLQTPGKPTYLNEGKFLDNGSCGWVLKPAILRDGDTDIAKYRSANPTFLTIDV
jgi:hypothetical protein